MLTKGQNSVKKNKRNRRDASHASGISKGKQENRKTDLFRNFFHKAQMVSFAKGNDSPNDNGCH